MNERVVAVLPRTTNSVEGWHRKFNRCVSAAHPSIWKLIDALRKDSAANDLSMAQEVLVELPPPQKRKYREANERISNIVRTYANRNTIDVLSGICYNLAN